MIFAIFDPSPLTVCINCSLFTFLLPAHVDCPVDNALGLHVQWSVMHLGVGFKFQSGCVRSPLNNYFKQGVALTGRNGTGPPCSFHMLRGSAKPCVNGHWLSQWEMAIFDPPQNRHPSTDHQKICHRWLCRRPLRLCQIRCISVHGGRLGTWVKYNQNYFYLCPFSGTHLQVRHVDGFSRMMAQATRTRARMCLFWEFFTLLPI